MKKMTKVLTTVLVIALAALTLAGCARKDTSPVTTDGSTSMEKVIGTLGEAFTEKEGINVTYNPTGSGSGIQAVSEGRCDIGLSSRALKDDEKASGLKETTLALDGIQDPGNLGTICRIADWFGIGHILCSPDTVDILNPKAVQATMGAISRVKVHYLPLAPYLKECHAAEMPVYGTFLDAPNIYQSQLSTNGIIVMGNEGKGISPDIEVLVNKRLYIPNYPSDRPTTDSLNVAVATAITCSEFRRRT